MGGQLDGIFLAGSLPHEFIILIVALFICLWLINFSLSLTDYTRHIVTLGYCVYLLTYLLRTSYWLAAAKQGWSVLG